MTDRTSGAWVNCAHLEQDNLKFLVDQWQVDIYGLFIAKRIDDHQEIIIERGTGFFELSDSSFNNGSFEANGAELQVVAGLVVFEQFPNLIGNDSFHPFPEQEMYGYSYYELPIEKNDLQDLLEFNECYVLTSTVSPFLEGFKFNEALPEGYSFRTKATRIGWENEGVAMYTSGYMESGNCGWNHVAELQSQSAISQPFTAALIICSIVFIILGMFFINRQRILKKLKSES